LSANSFINYRTSPDLRGNEGKGAVQGLLGRFFTICLPNESQTSYSYKGTTHCSCNV
jgi:hypothetical protein